MAISMSVPGYDPVRVMSLIDRNQDGPFTWSIWDQLFIDALITSRASGAGPTFGYADRDWSTLLTVLAKTQWMKDLHAQDEIDDGAWMYFAASEVDFFHVRSRSLMDHLAALLARCSTKPGTTPDTFFDLRKFLRDPKKKARFGSLGDDALGWLEIATWADDLKKVRDDIVHFGADTLVFPDEHEILFQIHKRQDRLVLLERVMHNEHIVDFRKYAALTLGSILLWREELASILKRGLDLESDPPTQGWNHHPGLAMLRDWSKLLA